MCTSRAHVSTGPRGGGTSRAAPPLGDPGPRAEGASLWSWWHPSSRYSLVQPTPSPAQSPGCRLPGPPPRPSPAPSPALAPCTVSPALGMAPRRPPHADRHSCHRSPPSIGSCRALSPADTRPPQGSPTAGPQRPRRRPGGGQCPGEGPSRGSEPCGRALGTQTRHSRAAGCCPLQT